MSIRDRHRDEIWAISKRCVSCGSCRGACRRRRGIARLKRPRHGHPVVFPEICRRCKYPACVEACISSALSRDSATGDLEFNAAKCVACWSCIMACPYAAVRRDLRWRAASVRCDRCGEYLRMACVSACPTGAMRCGDDAALRGDLARAGGLGGPLAAALICVALPLIGLIVGLLQTPWIVAHSHEFGIAAGGLMGVSLVGPMVGRLLSAMVRRSFWGLLHVWTGTCGAALAMVHTGGRFGANAQTAAAFMILALVIAAAAYRYLRPLVLIWEAMFYRAASAEFHQGDAEASRRSSNVEAVAAGASQARASRVSLGRVAAELAACKTLHVALAIIATGFVAAHVIIMLSIGAD